MEATRKPPQKSEPHYSGLASETRKMHRDGGQTLAELRTFLAQARGKSPQEFLGMVATSGLFSSTVAATVIVVAFIAVGTILPYAIYGPPDDTAKVKPAPIATAADGATKDSATATPGAAAANTSTSGTAADSGGKPNLDPLGVTGMEHAEKGKNPLEDSPELDNLLDKIK